MEELIGAKKHFSKIGWYYVIATALCLAVQVAISLLFGLFWPQLLENINISILLSMIPLYLFAFPAVILLMVKTVPAVKIERRRMTAGQYALAAIICLGLAYAANIVGNILTTVIGILKGGAVENEIASLTNSLSPAMIFFYMVLCAPFMEEFVFRKLIVDRVARYGQGAAVMVSGLMFGLFHGNLNQFIYATVIGMFLAFLYVKTGNLKITISLHMLFNFVGGFVSTLLLRLLDLEGYMEAAESGDFQSLVNHMGENLAGWILYGLFGLFVIGVMITGIVLFIVFAAKRRFACEKGEVYIPRELKYNIAFGNAGMLVFGLFWIVQIVLQLFQ
ncbi:MAG: CPBP family intramembrane metalloprotease [Roseburia sp.]|nr:CPBP family intramembrane metalloprotease [Roseburia sp.]